MTMTVSINAQNCVVDKFTERNSDISKIDILILDPNKTIKENYKKIIELLALHKENEYGKYTVIVKGHYISKKDSNDYYNEIICLKRIIKPFGGLSICEIINILTKLYSYSLDEPFKAECSSTRVNLVSVGKKINVETGRIFKDKKGNITKEYITRTSAPTYKNILYELDACSSIYKQTEEEVEREVLDLIIEKKTNCEE